MPFSSLTIFNEDINRPLKEEFIILILGPIFQLVFVSFFLSFNYIECVDKINNFLLFFNLLPIFPLDGYKFLNIFFNKIFSFKRSLILSLLISFVSIFFFFKYDFLLFLVLCFCFFNTLKEFLRRREIFNRFLLERYLKKYKFTKSIIVLNISSMKRDYRHIFKENGKYKTEYEKLKERFDIYRWMC